MADSKRQKIQKTIAGVIVLLLIWVVLHPKH